MQILRRLFKMSNGLVISEREFLCLPTKEQNLLLYQNQVKTLQLIKGYKFWYKVYSIIMGSVLIGVGVLFKLQLGGQ